MRSVMNSASVRSVPSVERARLSIGTDGTESEFMAGRMLNPTAQQKTWIVEPGSWDRAGRLRVRLGGEGADSRRHVSHEDLYHGEILVHCLHSHTDIEPWAG